MLFFKKYSNIKDFLYRFTILKIGGLHIRIHKINGADKSTLFHNHPFHYISILLSGGYTELYISNGKTKLIKHNFLSIICRKNSTKHRIEEVQKNTITLFFAFGNYGWRAFNSKNDFSNDGIFQRLINNKLVWSKKENGIWFIGNQNKRLAKEETRHSIHQLLPQI